MFLLATGNKISKSQQTIILLFGLDTLEGNMTPFTSFILNNNQTDLPRLEDIKFGSLTSFYYYLLWVGKIFVELEQHSVESSFSERFEEGKAFEHVSMSLC